MEPDSLVREADRIQKSGDCAAARERLDRALESAIDRPELLGRLYRVRAETELRGGDPVRADAYLSKGLHLSASADAWLLSAWIAMVLGDEDSVEPRLARSGDDGPRARLLRAWRALVRLEPAEPATGDDRDDRALEAAIRAELARGQASERDLLETALSFRGTLVPEDWLASMARRLAAIASPSPERTTAGILDVLRRAARARDPRRAVDHALLLLLEITGAERAMAIVCPRGKLEVEVSRGKPGDQFSRRIVREAMQSGREFRARGMESQGSIRAIGIADAVCLPLRARGRLVGALYADSSRELLAFDSDLVRAIADLSAIFLDPGPVAEVEGEDFLLSRRGRLALSLISRLAGQSDALRGAMDILVAVTGASRGELAAPEPGASERTADSLRVRLPSATVVLHGSFQEEDADLALAAAKRIEPLIAKESEVRDLREVVRSGLAELSKRHSFGDLAGSSAVMKKLYGELEKLAAVDYPAILEGETGAGKELAAKAVHFNGRRKDRPFLAVNCGAISETLLDSELFGHAKGAFTGADQARKGLFELADGGTLLLDEIEEMSPEMQKKLLRVLEDSKIRPVGGREVGVDVRVLAATNRELKSLVAKGAFREDLYYRIAALTVRVPPLRERSEDVPELAQRFLEEARPGGRLSPDVARALAKYDWPGNVRELRNEIRRLVTFVSGEIGIGDLPAHIAECAPADTRRLRRGGYKDRLADTDRQILLDALRANEWNLRATARALKIGRNTLARKMEKYGIEVP